MKPFKRYPENKLPRMKYERLAKGYEMLFGEPAIVFGIC
ncbi:hypothetical protein EKH55_3489 [Sinorhizobium alkalisoli]|nr:hypothetical protein EKH55_3489 [Sinorhizobium alkalisoli]